MHSVRDRLGKGGEHPLAGVVGLRFLLDQDVYAATARHLADVGHDVVRAADLGLSRATDEELLDVAREQGRLFVTRDRDFGRIVFLNRLRAPVLYLRMVPDTQDAVHRELDDALQTHGEETLAQAFVVIGPGGHRIRRLADHFSSPGPEDRSVQ